MSNLPEFFKDSSESYKFEEVIDYFMSWTIRCADHDFREHGLVHQYSKKILTKLLFGKVDDFEKITYKNIKTWKQWANIDLWAEVEVQGAKKYAIIIENKMYSSIRDGQLNKYKELAEAFCKVERIEYERKYIFLRPDYELESREKEFCVKSGYDYHNLDELKSMLDTEKLTGNDLFDEFWFNWKNYENPDKVETSATDIL